MSGPDFPLARSAALRHITARRLFNHTCHWPGCEKPVPANLWGCRPHWFALPKPIRDAIWSAYVPGQEITKTPSAAYLEAAQAAQDWIAKQAKP